MFLQLNRINDFLKLLIISCFNTVDKCIFCKVFTNKGLVHKGDQREYNVICVKIISI